MSDYYTKAHLAVRHCAAPEKTNYALTGVMFSHEKTIATDGKVMAIVSDRHAEKYNGTDILISKDTVDAITRMIPKKKKVPEEQKGVTINQDEQMATVQDQGVIRLIEEEGHFPPYEEVIPKEDGPDRVTIGLNPEYLIKLFKVAKEAGVLDGERALRFNFGRPDEPVLITGRNPDTGIEFTGVIMPINLL